jgi:hypothetical protein
MGEILIKNKGFNEIYLTRYYSGLYPYESNRDNVGFNDDNNPFSDYCFTTSCSTWQNDKIKILSLPDKGRLFYLTNPYAPTPIYANVVVGQMFIVRDLIDDRILRFNAEGSFDDQYSGNYLTQFNIQRFCGATSNNIISTVKLNMIEVRIGLQELYNVNIPQTCTGNGDGPTNYDVWCVGTKDFALSESIYLGANVGFYKMLIDGGTSQIGLTKQNGGMLNTSEILPITTMLTGSVAAAGENPPSSYPWGNPAVLTPAMYLFAFSLNGLNDWQNFTLAIYGQ